MDVENNLIGREMDVDLSEFDENDISEGKIEDNDVRFK